MRAKENFKLILKRWVETQTQHEISLSKLSVMLILSYTAVAIYLLNSEQNITSMTYMINASWGTFIAFAFYYKMPRFVPFVFYMIWSVVVSTIYRHIS